MQKRGYYYHIIRPSQKHPLNHKLLNTYLQVDYTNMHLTLNVIPGRLSDLEYIVYDLIANIVNTYTL